MNVVFIDQLGAIGNGQFDCTNVFADAFSRECVRVIVPKGVWLTGPVTINSHSELVLEENAVIKFIDNDSIYEPVKSRWGGIRCWCMHPLIYAQDAEDIKIFGKGTIDGNGKNWWDLFRDKKIRDAEPETEIEKILSMLNSDCKQHPGGEGGKNTQFLRPAAIQFNRCRNVLVSGISIVNSPFWTVHPVFSKNVTIENIKITNPYYSPNTDAIDVDSCSDVRIDGCVISVGDDGITIKSGDGEDGLDAGIPSSNIEVVNCTVYSAHGGAVIGSETAGGINNVKFCDCRFVDTDRGIRVKTRRGRGGTVENLSFKNISIKGCLCPVTFNMYYKCGTDESWPFSLEALPVTRTTPKIKNINIDNVNAEGCRSSAGFIVGLPESIIENVIIKDCCFKLSKESVDTDLSEMFKGIEHTDSRNIRVENANILFDNVRIMLENEKNYE